MSCYSQDMLSKPIVLRIYEDNDFMNIYGHGSDRRYTNGTRGDIFFTRNKNPASIFYRLSPKPGPESITEYSWGIMQAIITPDDLNRPFQQLNDYSYAGGLFATHSLYSSNIYRKLNIETDWIIGVMGPPALAKNVQVLVHKIGDYYTPEGWQYQLPTDLLLNYNLNFEKGILGNDKTWDLITGTEIYAGSMLDGISLSAQLRFGKLTPYFDGILNQLLADPKKFMISVSLIPALDVIFYNALLEGGLFNVNSPVRNKNEKYSVLQKEILKTHFDLRILMSFHKLSISYTQKTLSKDYKGMSGQNIGNISLYLKLK